MKQLLCLFLWSGTAFCYGQSYIYSFSGYVTDTSIDFAGIIAAQGLQVGDPVQYSFLVDFSRPGTITQNNGSILTMQDPPLGNVEHRYFHAQFLSGTQLHAKDGGSFNGPDALASINYGYDSSGLPPHEGVLYGGRQNETVQIFRQGQLIPAVKNWAIGDVLEAAAHANDSQLHDSHLVSSVTLDGIVAVPEPSSIALGVLGVGMLMVGRLRRTGA